MNAGDFTDVAGAFVVIGTAIGGIIGVLLPSDDPRALLDNIARCAAGLGWLGALFGAILYLVGTTFGA